MTHGVPAIQDVNRNIAVNLAEGIAALLREFGLDDRPAVPLSFGAVGFVEAAETFWLDDPAPPPLQDFANLLTGWMWSVLNYTLQQGGIDLDPYQPIAHQHR